MEMSKRFRLVVAAVLMLCVLWPTSGFSLQYAPGDPRNGTLEGHPSTGELNKAAVGHAKPITGSSRNHWIVISTGLVRLAIRFGPNFRLVIL